MRGVKRRREEEPPLAPLPSEPCIGIPAGVPLYVRAKIGGVRSPARSEALPADRTLRSRDDLLLALRNLSTDDDLDAFNPTRATVLLRDGSRYGGTARTFDLRRPRWFDELIAMACGAWHAGVNAVFVRFDRSEVEGEASEPATKKNTLV